MTAVNPGENMPFLILTYIKQYKEVGINNFEERYTSQGMFCGRLGKIYLVPQNLITECLLSLWGGKAKGGHFLQVGSLLI